jgi:hypothetical protein
MDLIHIISENLEKLCLRVHTRLSCCRTNLVVRNLRCICRCGLMDNAENIYCSQSLLPFGRMSGYGQSDERWNRRQLQRQNAGSRSAFRQIVMLIFLEQASHFYAIFNLQTNATSWPADLCFETKEQKRLLGLVRPLDLILMLRNFMTAIFSRSLQNCRSNGP